MGYQTPKIAQDVRRLRAELEVAVSNMTRMHRYDSGADLRRTIKRVQRYAVRAWRVSGGDRALTAHWLDQLVHEIDMLKEDLQLAQDVRAFRSLRQFRHLYSQALELGRQAGGWSKGKHPSAQNARARQGVPQRGQILSTHATPEGVNP